MLIAKSGISGWGLVLLSGSELVSSLLKADSNWLLRMLALLWLSLLRKSSAFFSGDTPVDLFPVYFI